MTVNQTYNLYVGGPFNDTLNSSISNICIKSYVSEELDRNISCGDVIESELISASDIQYFYFNTPSYLEYVLFDSCGSEFDTYLGLVTDEFQIINEGDDDGDCQQSQHHEQLLVEKLVAGKYVLIVLGYGTISNHSYGKWRVNVVCSISRNSSNAIAECDNYETIKCGSIFNGKLKHFRNNSILAYYDRLCFTLTNYSSMIYFDSCGSDGVTTLNLLYDNLTLMEYFNNGLCTQGAELKIGYLRPAKYILEIASEDIELSNNYKISVVCSENIGDNEQYKYIPYYYKQWFLAQLECEKQFGTSLATIATNRDMMKAIDSMDSFLEHGAYITFWVGLYNDVFTDAVLWQWVEGISCNSTSPNKCSSRFAWSIPGEISVPKGTFLDIYWQLGLPWNATSGIHEEIDDPTPSSAMPFCKFHVRIMLSFLCCQFMSISCQSLSIIFVLCQFMSI
eukprot:326272_1